MEISMNKNNSTQEASINCKECEHIWFDNMLEKTCICEKCNMNYTEFQEQEEKREMKKEGLRCDDCDCKYQGKSGLIQLCLRCNIHSEIEKINDNTKNWSDAEYRANFMSEIKLKISEIIYE